MKKTIILSVVFIGFMQIPSPSIGQILSPEQLKNGRNEAYNWVYRYDAYAICDGKRATDEFRTLFQSDTLRIYNDFFPMAGYDFLYPVISVSEYIDLLRDKHGFYKVQYTVRDAQIEGEKILQDTIFFRVSFVKEVGYYQDGSYQDDRYEYPLRPLKIAVTLAYCLADNNIHAVSFNCDEKPSSFVVIHTEDGCSYTKTTTLHSTCAVNSTPLFTYSIQSIPEDEKMYEYRIDTTKHYIGIAEGLGYVFVHAPITDSRFKEYAIDGGFHNNIMAKYYQQLSFKGNKRLGVEVGLLYHGSNVIANGVYYEYYDAVDQDGSPYRRIIESDNYKEVISQNILSVPITAKYEYFLNDHISLFGQAGAYLSYKLMSTRAEGNLRYKGYYEWLYDVVMDQNGIYDYGEYDISDATATYKFKDASIGFEGSLGGCYYFSNAWMVQASFRCTSDLWANTHKVSLYNLSEYNGAWMPVINIQDSYRLSDISFLLQINYNF